jgi:hypothetical protein
MALCPVGLMIDDPMHAPCHENCVAFGMGGTKFFFFSWRFPTTVAGLQA